MTKSRERDGHLSRVIGMRGDTSEQVAELYAAACPRLIGYLTVLTGSRSDAEEIAQDTFVQALRHWSKMGQYEDPTAWLHQVATRMAISRARRGQVARRGLRVLGGRRAEPNEDRAADTRLDLADALSRLPLDHRAVLLLHHFDDLPVAQVARVLGIAEGTVKSRLSRARAALEPMLDDPRSTT